MLWRLVLLFLSYIPLAAHFLRYGNLLLAVPLALLPFLALSRKTLVIQLLQAGLVAGVALVWIPTTIDIAQARIATGQPWARMAMILSGIMLFSLISAYFAKGIRPRSAVLPG